MNAVLVQADDFGLSHSINRAIILAHQEGILSGASLLANGPAFDDAVTLAKQNPTLSIGVHLNVYRGKPLSPPHLVRSLIHKRTGMFLQSLPGVIWKIVTKQFSLSQAHAEWQAQIKRILATGISPNRLDSEKHLHHLPQLAPLAIRLAKEFGIRNIRAIYEPLQYQDLGRLFWTGDWSRLLARRAFRKARRLFLEAGLHTPDRSFGFSRAITKETLASVLTSLPQSKGLTEIMCHPGMIRPAYAHETEPHGCFFASAQRTRELEALLDPTVKHILNHRALRGIPPYQRSQP